MGRATLSEQETIIRWDRQERIVNIWSADPTVWRRLRKLEFEPTREHRFADGTISGRFYEVPLAEFRWGKKRRHKGGFSAQNARLEANSDTGTEAAQRLR